MTVEYDDQAVQNVAYMLDLREPNERALDAIAQALDGAEPGEEFIADLATGVGKTYIAGGLLDYLWKSGVRNVVIVTPGSTIQRKTVDNLTPGHPKFLRGLQCDPLVVTLDTVERGEVGAALDDDSRMKVFVFTVQSLLRPNSQEGRRAHRPHETLGQALYEYLQGADDLVVIADEHHVYYSGSAKKFQAAIDELDPLALIGLTATPHEKTLSRRVFHYPLSEAIADGWVKIPVLVSRRDGMKDTRTQLADALTLLDAKAAAMTAYTSRARGKKYVEPVLFVVASTIDEANDIRDMLVGSDMIGDPDKVLLVTSEEPDTTLELLDGLEAPDNKVRAVVSVSMLKEGWDVKNIYVIAAVRSMESQLLTEQILGRGLRLPFGERTGNPMLDTVEVISHSSFKALLEQAEVLLAETLGDRVDAAEVAVNPTPGVNTTTMPATTLTQPSPGRVATESDDPAGDVAPAGDRLDWDTVEHVEVRLPGAAATDPNQQSLWDDHDEAAPSDTQGASHVSVGIATVEARVAAGHASQQALDATLTARTTLGVRLPLLLPRVTTRWVRDPFSLANVNLTSVEALGRSFADDNAPTLTRKALDAERDDVGDVRVIIRDEEEAVRAAQLPIPFDSIETDLVTRLLRTNGIAQTVTEANAAMKVAQAFLVGANVTEDTPWRAEHGRLATTKLTEWITGLQTASPAREVREVEHVRWPEPKERSETRPAADRHRIGSSRDFVRGYPYKGWARSLYDVNAFDAYSTEFRLATLFESDPAVSAWVRVDQTVPLRITYLIGAVQRSYEPDFIVVDGQGTYWIVEGKADTDMTDPLVLAKRDAAREWIRTVNAEPTVSNRWGYVLASESVIRDASSWAELRGAAQTWN